MLKLDQWWILHHPQIGLISGAVVLLDEKLWYCRIHSPIHKHIACLLTDITLVFFVLTVLSYTQWTTESWTLFKSLFSWYRCPTSRSGWWTTCKIWTMTSRTSTRRIVAPLSHLCQKGVEQRYESNFVTFGVSVSMSNWHVSCIWVLTHTGGNGR